MKTKMFDVQIIFMKLASLKQAQDTLIYAIPMQPML
jgi:hypothetical protein